MNVGAGVLGSSAIPGDPVGLRALATQLQSAGSDVEAVQNRVATNGLQGAWSGSAADAFRASLDKLPGELAKVAAAFGDASLSVTNFAEIVAELQANASYYASQVSNGQAELEAAQARHAAAETKLAAARFAHSVATEPFSLRAAANALSLATSLTRQAVADIEETSSTIERFVRAAETNRTEYDNAVRACCTGLGVAYDTGTRSFGAWADGHARGLFGHFESSWHAVVRQGGKARKEAETELGHVARDVEHVTRQAKHAADNVASAVWSVPVAAYHFAVNAGHQTGAALYDYAEDPSWSTAKEVLGAVGTDAFVVAAGVGLVLGGAEIAAGVGLVGGLGGLDAVATVGASAAEQTGVDLFGVGALNLLDPAAVELGTGALGFTGGVGVTTDLAATGGDVASVVDGHESVAQGTKNIADDTLRLAGDAADAVIPDAHGLLAPVVSQGTSWVEDKAAPALGSAAHSYETNVTTDPTATEFKIVRFLTPLPEPLAV